jgi:hypothetical protein
MINLIYATSQLDDLNSDKALILNIQAIELEKISILFGTKVAH